MHGRQRRHIRCKQRNCEKLIQFNLTMPNLLWINRVIYNAQNYQTMDQQILVPLHIKVRLYCNYIFHLRLNQKDLFSVNIIPTNMCMELNPDDQTAYVYDWRYFQNIQPCVHSCRPYKWLRVRRMYIYKYYVNHTKFTKKKTHVVILNGC